MRIRRAIAGAFYRGDCREQVRKFLDGDDVPPRNEPIPGAVVPHAGWVYSGRVAAQVWARVAAAGPPETVVILGAVHRSYSPAGAAVWADGGWETPVGMVPIDEELAKDMIQALGSQLVDNPSAHVAEHSIEVQLPMVRLLLPEASIVPVAVPPEEESCALGVAMGKFLAACGKPVTVVSSTDLTHYGPGYGLAPAGVGERAEAWMKANDRRFLDLMEQMASDRIIEEARMHHNACGAGAVAAAMGAARELGATHGTVTEYTTSHRESPESRVFSMAVGYAGVLFVK